MSPRTSWYGSCPLAPEQSGVLRLGPLRLLLHRGRDDWLIDYHHDQAPERVWTWAPDTEVRPSSDDTTRVVLGSTVEAVDLVPQLADRAVVSRPHWPVVVPAGERAQLYVTTPLWVWVGVARKDRLFLEVPCAPPKGTWFGPNPTEGELCYDNLTRCRTRLEDQEPSPWRAITPLQIRNRGEEPLALERIKIPVPLLSLFEALDGSFWTETLRLDGEAGTDMAAVRIQDGPPKQAQEVVTPPEGTDRKAGGSMVRRVSDSRLDRTRNTVIRAFSALMRG